MPVGDLLPELAVLAAAVAALFCAITLPQRRQAWCAVPAALGVTVALAAAWAQVGAAPRLTFSGVWALDDIAVWAKLIVLVTTLLTLPLIPEWLRRDRRHGEFYTLVLFAALGALMMASAADTMELVIGVLLSSVTGYTLVAYHRDWDASVEAGMKYFLVGAMANALLLIGVVWLFGLAGSTDYRVMAQSAADATAPGAWLAAAALVVAGLAFKIGAVPGHPWMPDVAEGAPAPAAAFVLVAPKVGAAVALARLGAVLSEALPGWQPLLAALALVTMTLGNLAALGQRDLRRLLGWSAVSQSGYALVAVAMIGHSAFAASALLFFLAAYAAANVAAFAVITELRGRTRLDDYRGLAATRPALIAALAVALLSFIGIPPLGGFVGKLLLMLAAVDGMFGWLALAVVINSALSAYYYLRVIGPAYFDSAPAPAALLGRRTRLAVWPATALVVGLGPGAAWLLAAMGTPVLLP